MAPPGYEQAGKAHSGSAAPGRVIEVTDIPVASVGEANEVATGILTKLSMDWMKATVLIQGRPDVHAGDIVDLKEFGVRYSGEYLVEGCTHKFHCGRRHAYTKRPCTVRGTDRLSRELADRMSGLAKKPGCLPVLANGSAWQFLIEPGDLPGFVRTADWRVRACRVAIWVC